MVVPLCQITAAVSIPAFKLDKFVRRHLRLAHIAPADAITNNQQFTRHPGRQKVAVLVYHHHPDVCHRLANRNLIPGYLVEGTANRCLCRPIAIKGNGIRSQSHNLVIERLRECLRTYIKDLNLRQCFLHLRHINNID